MSFHAVKTMKTISGWLSEPDAPVGDADIEYLNPLACAPERVAYGRPLLHRMVASPSLVSRLVRKSAGWTITPAPAFVPLDRRSSDQLPAVALPEDC
jgi:hypothetical protein